MITKQEIQQVALASNLSASQVEKDYVLGWLLAGISAHPQLSKAWVFKGGTCLRKMYIENYRYSEDLDFTSIEKESFDIDIINKYINDTLEWVFKKSGIEVDTSRSVFDELYNAAGQNIIQGKIYYRGPVSPIASRQWPRIKLDITTDEIIITAPCSLNIIHPYSDQVSLNSYMVNAYSRYDLFSEKMRAFFERSRPRDLYDVVEMSKKFNTLDLSFFKECFMKKCNFKKVKLLEMTKSKLEVCESAWNDQLSHQLRDLPKFEEYLKEFQIFYGNLRF